ncbi:MAG TPA: hypothetical protein VM509_12045, partial [Planctomycetota bacterium]|nr:hypothetical protein [Planctomycetota bacterium]
WRADTKELDPEEIQRRFALLQLATPGVLQAALAAGDAPKACAEGLRMLDVWHRERLALVAPYGNQSLLGLVAALDVAGGFVGGELDAGTLEWFASAPAMRAKFADERQQRSALELALALARQVGDENRGNAFGTRAERWIDELALQPDADVSPEILIDAARGKADDHDFLGALAAYKRVLTALDAQDTSVRTALSPKVLGAIGRCYLALERPLEAALVFQEALARFPGDPRFDAQNADGFYAAASQLGRKIHGDAAIDALSEAANRAKLDHPGEGSGTGDIVYGQAARAYEAKDYARARELFEAVTADADQYEKARVFVGVCEYQLGKEKNDFAAALRVFDGYLNTFLADPLHALGPGETRKEFRRTEATATAVFYRGACEFLLAEAGKGAWERVVEVLGGFEDRFAQQPELSSPALYRVIVAQQHLGRPQEVDALFAKQRERFPTDRWTVRSALDVYALLDQDVRKSKESKTPEAPEQAKELTRKMATYLEFANSNAASPAFGNLRRESQLWMQLEAWAKAEALLKKIRSRFEAGADADNVQKFILPELGIALFRQQKLQEAADVLGPLVEAKQATASLTRIYARALSGYAEPVVEGGKPRSMRIVPGIGGVESFEKAAELYGKLLETEKSLGAGAWTSAWLDLKFDQIYCLCSWAKIDSKRVEDSRALVQLVVTEFDGHELPGLRDADTKSKYLWLIGQVK